MRNATVPRMKITEVPGTAAPLHRALAAEGWETLADLDGVPRTTLATLHGVGSVGLKRLELAMAEEGHHLAEGHAVWTATDRGQAPVGTGTQSPDIKTVATDADVEAYVDSLEPRRAEHGRWLLKVFGEVTGEAPRMWGPSMVGYGEMHYLYATGREGDTMRLGFSPRKAALSLYGLTFYGSNDDLLARLGKHRLGKGCLYVNKPEDIDESVLRELIARAWAVDGADGC